MIRALILDLDGTLTDGGYAVDCQGCVCKTYNTRDFFMIEKLSSVGIKTYVVTSSHDKCDLHKMVSLNIPLYQKVKEKHTFLESVLLPEINLSWSDIFYMGDYPNDKKCLESSRLSACPSDSHSDIMDIDGILITSSPGGGACVAEAICWYLRTFNEQQGKDVK